MTIGSQVEEEAQKHFEVTGRVPSVHLGRAASAAFREEMRPFLDDELEPDEVERGVIVRFGELDVFLDEGGDPWAVSVTDKVHVT